MFFKIYTPRPPLDLMIESITYFDHFNSPHSIERFLPDGHVDLIINLTAEPRFTFDNHSLQKKQGYKKAWISGARKSLISIDAGGKDDSMMVVRFKLGGAYSILGIPQDQLSEQIVEAEEILGPDFNNTREAILHATQPAEKINTLENFLLRISNEIVALPSILQFTLDTLKEEPGITIGEIVAKTGYSHKHFISMFKAHMGMSPKELYKILRFQQVIKDIEYSATVEWSRLALDCGYYDQAHFIKDFKQFSGYNPKQYLLVKGETLNYIPVR